MSIQMNNPRATRPVVTIELVEVFSDIKEYITPELIDLISDDSASNILMFTYPVVWVKFKVNGKLCALFMLKPLNNITVEIHPVIKSEHAKYAVQCVATLVDWLKDCGKTSVTCAFPNRGTATKKLAKLCGFTQVGTLLNSWLKRGKYYDILIYQKEV
jgi:hypothetical protein